ncbi:histidine phosphatase family protein [Microvirga antarctica]|uniref:histidine phosphatase family protein n=1 Tax=Microvirga antarctica TaxID=2819233 RepID=UPI001B3061A6|nr:histidine phosphatase family protein [Microvirga antarctica]
MKKVVHCIRHGQSTFNAQFEAAGGVDPLHFDAVLSPLGEQQVAAAAVALRAIDYELIVTSPLTRALQTTLGLLGDHPSRQRIRVECLHREHLANSCDVGRAPALLAEAFPGLAFSHLDETWWHRDGEADARGIVVEPDSVLTARVAAFRQWLTERPERLIAVVGHGTFFSHLTGRHLQNCEIATLEL